jgi:ParB family chromosome partitioning protein
MYPAIEEKARRSGGKLNTLAESLEHFSPGDLAIADAIGTVSCEGQLKIERALSIRRT